MKLYEYQAKELFKKYSIPVPEGKVAFSAEEAVKIFKLSGKKAAVKAQVHTGGRGKAGGIKLGSTEEEIKDISGRILGMEIKGLTVDRVLVEEAIDIDREFYMSITVDRAKQAPIFISSTMGGVDIEEVAKTSHESINKIHIDPYLGIRMYQIKAFTGRAGLEKDTEKQVTGIAKNLYRMFESIDAGLVEINPLVITKDKKVYAADAKVDIDDNAQYRQEEIISDIKGDLEKSVEYRAKEQGLSYVKMDGNIGCVVNGAGLSMATMDIIKLFGGEPANFLDIGGSSNPEKVKSAMKLLMADKNVKVAFFNVFGGITRCDDVAKGIVAALKDIDVKFPIVIRLTGTNEEEGKEILKETDLIFSETMVDAAKKAVELIKE